MNKLENSAADVCGVVYSFKSNKVDNSYFSDILTMIYQPIRFFICYLWFRQFPCNITLYRELLAEYNYMYSEFSIGHAKC